MILHLGNITIHVTIYLQSANAVCAETGLCDANATIQGMVMGSLRSDFARDRVIKRMLMRARVMQQKSKIVLISSFNGTSPCPHLSI